MKGYTMTVYFPRGQIVIAVALEIFQVVLFRHKSVKATPPTTLPPTTPPRFYFTKQSTSCFTQKGNT